MQKLKLFSLFFTLFLLLGCYEVNEEIVLNENGSGSFVTKMDMAQLIEMMQSFGESEMNQEGLDKLIDTVISMKSIADSAKEITPEQKALLSAGKLRLQMNLKEKIFKIDTDIPFKSYNDLQFLLTGGGGMAGMSDMMKKIFDKGGEQEKNDQPDTPKDLDPDLSQLSNIFDVVVKNGTISKKLNQDKYKLLMERPEMAQMKQVGSAGIEILYSTSIKLPRPVKSSDNPLIKLSDDKKTVTIKYNYLEVFETPEKFAYTISY